MLSFIKKKLGPIINTLTYQEVIFFVNLAFNQLKNTANLGNPFAAKLKVTRFKNCQFRKFTDLSMSLRETKFSNEIYLLHLDYIRACPLISISNSLKLIHILFLHYFVQKNFLLLTNKKSYHLSVL